MRARGMWLVAAVTIFLGCTPSPAGPLRPPPERPTPHAACPLGVEGTRVEVEDTSEGVAIVFHSADAERELRDRVNAAAALHGPFGRQGKGHRGRHGMGGHHGLQAATLPLARAVVTEVEGGARLSLVALYPSEWDTLRSRVRDRATKMTTVPCDL